jgi:hypothetical protein
VTEPPPPHPATPRRASVLPTRLDLTDCPYMWPFCKQPLYASAMPAMFNATILNGMAVTGRVSKAPVFEASDEGGTHLHLEFEHSVLLWPWSGYLALYIRVRDSGKEYTGNASGVVRFEVTSPPRPGSDQEQVSAVELHVKVGTAQGAGDCPAGMVAPCHVAPHMLRHAACHVAPHMLRHAACHQSKAVCDLTGRGPDAPKAPAMLMRAAALHHAWQEWADACMLRNLKPVRRVFSPHPQPASLAPTGGHHPYSSPAAPRAV